MSRGEIVIVVQGAPRRNRTTQARRTRNACCARCSRNCRCRRPRGSPRAHRPRAQRALRARARARAAGLTAVRGRRRYTARGSRPGNRCVDTRRKVRAPQGKVPGNAWGARAHGQCNRKQTAYVGASRQVRVKGCGKSAPRRWQHSAARQTPPGARPNREARGSRSVPAARRGFRVGRSRRRRRASQMDGCPRQNPAYRPTPTFSPGGTKSDHVKAHSDHRSGSAAGGCWPTFSHHRRPWLGHDVSTPGAPHRTVRPLIPMADTARHLCRSWSRRLAVFPTSRPLLTLVKKVSLTD